MCVSTANTPSLAPHLPSSPPVVSWAAFTRRREPASERRAQARAERREAPRDSAARRRKFEAHGK